MGKTIKKIILTVMAAAALSAGTVSANTNCSGLSRPPARASAPRKQVAPTFWAAPA